MNSRKSSHQGTAKYPIKDNNRRGKDEYSKYVRKEDNYVNNDKAHTPYTPKRPSRKSNRFGRVIVVVAALVVLFFIFFRMCPQCGIQVVKQISKSSGEIVGTARFCTQCGSALIGIPLL